MNSEGIRGPYFTPEQYKQILKLFGKENVTDSSTNMEGNDVITAFSVESNCKEWIIDTEATYHMTSNLNLLDNTVKIGEPKEKKASLLNGSFTYVTYTWSCRLNDKEIVSNVLYIPDFKYNLLSVSKLTKELKCSALFFSEFCVFQDLYSGKVRGIGKERGGLYLLTQTYAKDNTAEITSLIASKEKQDIELWHTMLCHASIKTLIQLFHFSQNSCKS